MNDIPGKETSDEVASKAAWLIHPKTKITMAELQNRVEKEWGGGCSYVEFLRQYVDAANAAGGSAMSQSVKNANEKGGLFKTALGKLTGKNA